MRLKQKNSCNLIRIAAGDKLKTVFCIKQGVFKNIVVQVVLTNTPVSFPAMMNAIFLDMARWICSLYNILMYSGNTEVEHQAIVEQVLEQCVEHRLIVNLLKCQFNVCKTRFLVYVIHALEVKIDPVKLESIAKRPICWKKKQVAVFSDCELLQSMYCQLLSYGLSLEQHDKRYSTCL